MRQRSSYPKPFKAQVVQECLQPGATVSSVAISHGINANVIRKLDAALSRPACSDFTTGIRSAKTPHLNGQPNASVIIELP
uniref:transposase n=1 Tax=Pseudomonas asplenii TaxID=53407 RepID=UPI0003627A17